MGCIWAQTRLEYQVVSRVVIEIGQRMTGCIPCFKMPFKIDLLQVIGLGVLKALPGLAALAGLFVDQAMSVQNTANGTGGGNGVDTKITHALRNLAPTPSRMFMT